MRRSLLLLVLLAACAGELARPEPQAIADDAAVTESFEVRTYMVRGETLEEVRRAISAARPADSDGKRYDAITRWQVHYRFDAEAGSAGCAASRPRVSLKLRMELPALDAVPEQTRAEITPYLEALREHEQGHLRIDRGVARAVADAIRSVPPQFTCERLREEVRRAADRAMEEGRKSDRAYDDETRHGRTQGAVWPR
ncbi:MAG: DUF922 domain-containing protein [Myxococcales bacterium]